MVADFVFEVKRPDEGSSFFHICFEPEVFQILAQDLRRNKAEFVLRGEPGKQLVRVECFYGNEDLLTDLNFLLSIDDDEKDHGEFFEGVDCITSHE